MIKIFLRWIADDFTAHCVALGLQKYRAELLGALAPCFVMRVGHVPVINDYRPGDPGAALEVARPSPGTMSVARRFALHRLKACSRPVAQSGKSTRKKTCPNSLLTYQ